MIHAEETRAFIRHHYRHFNAAALIDAAAAYQELIDGGGRMFLAVGRGDGVGEISLLREVPCTATVRAAGTAMVYAMEAEPFVEAVRCHPASGAAAERLVRERQPPIENIDSRSCWEKTSKATIV